MNDIFIERDIENAASEELKEFPVVVLQGARQVGKTTLAKRLCEQLDGQYWTMDSMREMSRLRDDPDQLGDGSGFVVIDEIQLFPELVREVKRIVDNNRRAGMFLLTGSADRYRMRVSFNPLGVRKKHLFMRPYSQFELRRAKGANSQHANSSKPAGSGNVIDSILSGLSPPDRTTEGLEVEVRKGGYPVMRSARSKAKSTEEYLYEEILGDLLEAAGEIGLEKQQLLFRKMAGNIGRIRNIRLISEDTDISEHLVKKVHDHLSNMFIVEPLPSFGEKVRNRKLTKTNKVYMNDCGLATTLLGLDDVDLVSSPHWGMLVENFVLAELRKHKETSSLGPLSEFCYYRENNGIEVDFILKTTSGCVAFEVKASKTVGGSDRSNLVEFKTALGKRCKRAIIFYGGERTIKHDDGVEAWPISSLTEPW